MSKNIRAFAPATVANVCCGFDIMGFALESPGDVVEITLTDTPGITISKITGDNGDLPTDPKQNTAGIAVRAMADYIQFNGGIDISLEKNMPLGSGLGSSAASAVAAVTAFNALLDNPLKNSDLLPFILEGEKAASGTPHADNAAPSLMGGFILVRSTNPLDLIPLTYPNELCCVVVHPDLKINTRSARKILKQKINLLDAITQWGNVGGLISGLASSDFDLISRSLVDVVAEPVRSGLIPGFDEVKRSALDVGALGCGISGSGPAMFALCNEMEMAENVGNRMQEIWRTLNIDSNIYLSIINKIGAKILY